MSRAVGGETIHRNDEDRRRFPGLVAELPGRYMAEVHAFPLMDNHHHLLMRCRRTWAEMSERCGDWGRDGTMAVATRRLGWRLVDVVRAVPGIGSTAATQGVRRFRGQAEQRPELAAFANRFQRAVENCR